MKLLIVFACILLMVGSSTSFECGPNSHYTPCVSNCPMTCFSLYAHNFCDEECLSDGCACDNGYVLDVDGNCVTKDDCLETERVCGPNAIFISCGSGCYYPPVICGKSTGEEVEPSTEPRICPDVCVPRCYCNSGFWKNSKGECVLPEVCE
ncbi:PREDICTED: von Willebrand factor-like isoform X2 [Nicrophorus vespilloides]|uniref:von Willebrand factor-like isoform X2 n=1 Tax=Nicrophorus vespilloides TaxID=110193 RepID=A0ABM1NJJ2_NICVS|nr:PREDICTED: von Willebrand factor-like isoform X2 [Nicrophorus vespilloides]